jgi:PAS domain S-box-containing protein
VSLKALFEEAPCGLAMADAEGRLTLGNRAFMELAGAPLGELLGRRVTTLFTLAGQMVFETSLLPLLQMQGFLREIALELRCADGEPRPVLLNASMQRDAQGRVQSIAYSMLDARERRGFERQLITARKRAEVEAQARGAFISHLSHEIRTPLQAILGITELLASSAEAQARDGHLETVRSSAEHLLALVNDLLDFGKAEAGKATLELRPFELPEAVASVLALLRPKAVGLGLFLKAEVAPGVPSRVHGDVVKLRQILTNLVGNALKFTEQGGVTVQLSKGANGSVCFAVIDTGIGIEAEQLPRLFEAFTQAGTDTTRRFGGTGLGLTISRQLVELHGGRLEIDSRVGEGTAFRFELPYAQAESEPVLVPEARGRLGDALVLVAEDNTISALLVRRCLERLGVRAEMVCDGAAAVERVRAGGVGVALLDLQMPVLDGTGALQAIRALPDAASRTPLVAFSATVDAHERAALLRLGFDACLAKPLEQAALLEVLRALLPKAVAAT